MGTVIAALAVCCTSLSVKVVNAIFSFAFHSDWRLIKGSELQDVLPGARGHRCFVQRMPYA